MECSTSKRRSKNLFKTALNKLVGKHVDNMYEVTVIYNNDGDNQEANSNSAQNISIHNNHQKHKSSEKNYINDEPPKVPPRRKSRPYSQNSNESFEIHKLFQSEYMNTQNIKIKNKKENNSHLVIT